MNYQNPHSTQTSSEIPETESYPNTQSLNDEIHETLSRLKLIVSESKALNEANDEIRPVTNESEQDCRLLLHEIIPYVKMPDEIYSEEDTGHIIISWHVSKSDIINILITGSSNIIISSARSSSHYSETVETIEHACTVIKNTYNRYSSAKNGSENPRKH